MICRSILIKLAIHHNLNSCLNVQVDGNAIKIWHTFASLSVLNFFSAKTKTSSSCLLCKMKMFDVLLHCLQHNLSHILHLHGFALFAVGVAHHGGAEGAAYGQRRGSGALGLGEAVGVHSF